METNPGDAGALAFDLCGGGVVKVNPETEGLHWMALLQTPQEGRAPNCVVATVRVDAAMLYGGDQPEMFGLLALVQVGAWGSDGMLTAALPPPGDGGNVRTDGVHDSERLWREYLNERHGPRWSTRDALRTLACIGVPQDEGAERLCRSALDGKLPKRATQRAKAPDGGGKRRRPESGPRVIEELLAQVAAKDAAKKDMQQRVEEKLTSVMDNGVRVNRALQAVHRGGGDDGDSRAAPEQNAKRKRCEAGADSDGNYESESEAE